MTREEFEKKNDECRDFMKIYGAVRMVAKAKEDMQKSQKLIGWTMALVCSGEEVILAYGLSKDDAMSIVEKMASETEKAIEQL
jgi:hypothetical protein